MTKQECPMCHKPMKEDESLRPVLDLYGDVSHYVHADSCGEQLNRMAEYVTKRGK